jgi:hypothetical protein
MNVAGVIVDSVPYNFKIEHAGYKADVQSLRKYPCYYGSCLQFGYFNEMVEQDINIVESTWIKIFQALQKCRKLMPPYEFQRYYDKFLSSTCKQNSVCWLVLFGAVPNGQKAYQGIFKMIL